METLGRRIWLDSADKHLMGGAGASKAATLRSPRTGLTTVPRCRFLPTSQQPRPHLTPSASSLQAPR